MQNMTLLMLLFCGGERGFKYKTLSLHHHKSSWKNVTTQSGSHTITKFLAENMGIAMTLA
jgi:hypothetical protein